jgi:hypoxanthine phosphoribosyltransferase
MRGGWYEGLVLSDLLFLKDLFGMKIEHWGETGEMNKETRITQSINVNLKERNVLIVDDITDTGDSIKVAMEQIAKLKPREIKTAVLQHKKTSSFQPDYYGEIIDEWRWIIYPWNFYEDVSNLIKDILEGEMDIKRIKEGLEDDFSLHIEEKRLVEVLERMKFYDEVEYGGGFWKRKHSE